VYETVLYVLIFVFLWSIRTRPHPSGSLFWWYLVLASTARLLVEFVRINPPFMFGLTEAQVTSLLLIAIGTWRLVAARGFTVHPVASLSPSKQ
jgi:phosphatidylglycerol:prolipoprotein diacylglycerol transferase